MSITVAQPVVAVVGVFEEGEVFSFPPANVSMPGGLTLAGSTNVLAIPTDRTRGEYGTDLIFALDNWDGQRLISERILDDEFLAEDIDRQTLLQAVDSLRLATAPVQNDLIASLGVSEQPTLRVVVHNRNAYWTRVIGTEVLLYMTGTVALAFSGEMIHAIFKGQILQVTYQKDAVEFLIGEP